MSKAQIEQGLMAQCCRYCVELCFLALLSTLHYLIWGALENEIGWSKFCVGEERLKWIVWEWVAVATFVFVGVTIYGVFCRISKPRFCEHYGMNNFKHLDSLSSQNCGFQKRVLLVEDTKINRIILRKVLERLNLHCEEAENGKIAVDYIKQGRTYDLVLMDKEMPIMDGHEATRQLRRMGVKTPIVALSANSLQSDKDLFFEAGVDDFQTKPLSREKLLQLLARYGLESSCTEK
ncbi:two-component response regulator ORR41 [Cryptomeria japonica]|uniref:two-component response regulator ORR41 n=1 Tax=Cryptomeria japonica TaxID=3369 RepID=UPI0027DA4F05|nr:two-component response regulator ORR41 [Cryptomeria japonica]